MSFVTHKVDVDSFDLILAVALWGGFETGNWLPFCILVALAFLFAPDEKP